jgi:hypothetical protein
MKSGSDEGGEAANPSLSPSAADHDVVGSRRLGRLLTEGNARPTTLSHPRPGPRSATCHSLYSVINPGSPLLYLVFTQP